MTSHPGKKGWDLLNEEILRQKQMDEALAAAPQTMTTFQEIQSLEGNLSASTTQRLKAQCSNESEYLEALRREYAAVQEAIARLENP